MTKKEVLIISYYFDPYPGVGAKRLSYWAKAFWTDSDFDATVLTATPQPTSRQKVFFIPHKKSPADRLVFGLGWIRSIKKWLAANLANESFHYVLISGGPFGHFLLSTELRRRFSLRVALDFRDPFSGNVRFGASSLSEFFKRRFEQLAFRHADRIITVNDCCQRILERTAGSVPVSVIENGYDETIVDKIEGMPSTDGPLHIVHAGKFYVEQRTFVTALLSWNKTFPNKQFVFHHIGEKSPDLDGIDDQVVVQHGPMPYDDTIAMMKRCHIGLLLTGESLLEYNTKVFDYIGCNLDVFIVTQGTKEAGCIHGLTKRISQRTFWAKATEQEIHMIFEKYRRSSGAFQERARFSRRAGFLQLKQILSEQPQPPH